MIATGTDIRPLEVLVFMRDVKSRSYYEQMKGRGTRICSLEQLKATGTPAAKMTKDHFVIIDAIGVEQSQKTDSRPLEKKPGVSLKDLLQSVAVGARDEDSLTTLANRLIRLDKQINEKEKTTFAAGANGQTINHVVKELLNAYDPDTIQNLEVKIKNENPDASQQEIEKAVQSQHTELIEEAVKVFHNPELRNFIVDVRKKYDQTIDTINQDEISNIGWVKDQEAAAELTISNFTTWIEAHKDEITALQIFYGQPYRRRELTYKMIKDLYEKIMIEQPMLAPMQVWRAYEQVGNNTNSSRIVSQSLSKAGSDSNADSQSHAFGQAGLANPNSTNANSLSTKNVSQSLSKAGLNPPKTTAKNELIALVSLIRRVSGIDQNLIPYDKTVDRNFQQWILRKNAGQHNRFTEEQMHWLRMIKDFVANSFHVEKEDFELDPFNKEGGLGKMWQLFGEEAEGIINELNEVLAA